MLILLLLMFLLPPYDLSADTKELFCLCTIPCCHYFYIVLIHLAPKAKNSSLEYSLGEITSVKQVLLSNEDNI